MNKNQPLSGITILEVGHSIAAPFAGMVLAELGARVVKLEMPGEGDYCRGWGPPFVDDGSAIAFEAVNRGKESIVVDLKSDDEIARLRSFIDTDVDVLLHNLKFRALDRFGMSDEALRAQKPGLIYCHLGAFGAVGPMKEKPGYDPLMQAFGGLMSIMGEPGQSPSRIGVSIIDISTGMWAAIGILAALQQRNRTGEGCVVDTSLFESALTWMGTPIASYLASGKVPGPVGSGSPMIAPYQAFPTKDGHLMILAGNDLLFRKTCHALDMPYLAEDMRFRTNGQRVARRDELIPLIEYRTRSEASASLAAKLDAVGVPNGPILSVDQVVAAAQTEALSILQSSPDGKLRLMGMPLSFDGQRPQFLKRAPELGADNHILEGNNAARQRQAGATSGV